MSEWKTLNSVGLKTLFSGAEGRRLLLSIVVLLLLGLGAELFLQRLFLAPHHQEEKFETVLKLGSLRAHLEGELTRNLLLLQGMAAHFAVMPEQATKSFDTMAAELMNTPNALRNMAAAPDFVIRHVYPLEGNEAVLGIDYRDLPQQWPQALEAKVTGRMVVAGPVDLVQGGRGLVGRVPVFTGPEQRFWGLVSALLDMDTLLREAGLLPQPPELQVALQATDKKGVKDVFYGDPTLFLSEADAVHLTVELPNDIWVLAGTPKGGWSTTHPDTWRVRLGLGLILGLLVALMIFRKLKEQQLRAVRDSLARAQAIGGVGSWEWDVAADRIYWSQETRRIFGIQEQDAVFGLEDYLERVHPDDREAVGRQVQTALKEGATGYDVEHRILRSGEQGSELVWVAGAASIERDEEGRPRRLAGTVQDVTGKKLAELALQESERRFRDLTLLTGDWVWEVDAQGRYVYTSGRVKDILGFEPEELLGASPFEIMIEEDAARIGPLFTEIARNREPLRDLENWNRAKDGSLVCLLTSATPVLDEAGELQGYRGVDKDITATKQAQDALRESEERLSLAIEGTQVGLWDWQVQTGETYFNERWANVTGYTLAELEPVSIETWTGLCHPDDLARSEKLLQEHFRGESEVYECEARMRHKNGHWVWVLDKGKVVERDVNGAPLRMAGTHQDITDRKLAEEQLEKARQHVYDILESTTDAFFEVDASFNLIYINQKAEKALGLDREAHLGRNLWELFPQAVGTSFYEAYVHSLQQQEVVTLEEYYAPFDTWFEIYAYPTPLSLSVYFHDITKRRLLQEERNNIFTLSLDMICTAGLDGHFRELNPSWERTLGWTLEELKAVPWLEFVHPDDVEPTLTAGRRLLEGEEVQGFANRYRCKDGSYRWLSWNSYPNLERKLIYAVVRDVTEDRQAQEALQTSEERFRRLVESAPLGLALTDRQGGVKYLNPRLVEMLGYTQEDVPDMERLWAAVCPDDVYRTAALRDWRETVKKAHSSGEELAPLERRVRSRDGEEKVVEFRYMPLEQEGVTLFTDITLRKQLEVELTRLATVDPLTGSHNRRQFMQLGDREFGMFVRYGRVCSVLMLDIDHFKKVNDTWGHHVGDKVLQLFAEVCAQSLRESDIFGRLGGEEFAAVLPETDQDEALAVAERLRSRIEDSEYRKASLQVPFTVSVGLAVASPGDSSLEDVLRRADEALYEAKREGRNRVCMHEAPDEGENGESP